MSRVYGVFFVKIVVFINIYWVFGEFVCVCVLIECVIFEIKFFLNDFCWCELIIYYDEG